MLRLHSKVLGLTKTQSWLAPGLAGLLAFPHAAAMAPTPAVAAAQELTVTASFAGKESVAPDEQIELLLNRPLQPSEGRLAVFVGQTDLTNLFTVTERGLNYGPNALPLPAGEAEVTVYLVSSSNDWRELTRFPLRVPAPAATAQPEAQPAAAGASPSAQPGQPEQRRRFGFDKFDIAPALNIGFKSQFAETHFPASNRPERTTFTDATVQGSLKTEMGRGQWSMQSQYQIAVSEFRKEALRFNQLGANAPKVDLANYLMQFQHGQQRFMAGHTTYGTNRHLITNFASRGLTLTFPLGSRSDFAVAALNGTNDVGWDNFFGIANRRHQILSGTFGFEFFPHRRGGLRFEAGLLNGWLQPRNSFNQGSINDAERSQGLSFRLLFTDKAQRLRFDGSLTRGRFTNPNDPLLNRGFDLVPVRETTRGARYVEVGYDLLKDFAVSSVPTQTRAQAQTPATARKLNLTLNLRHERVDPLFRSIGATQLQADRYQNQLELIGSFGEVSFNATHVRFNDNLAGIPSILKTFTRRNAFAANAPLATLLGNDPTQPSPIMLKWLPRVGYTFDRVHAFAAFVPINGGFNDPSTIPDQVSLNQTFIAEWQTPQLRFSYRFNHSLQDNRQRGRERADLENFINGFTLEWSPLTTFELNFDVSAESATNRETARTDRTLRFGFGTRWQITPRAILNANFSTIGVGDVARTSRNRNAEFDLQWSWRFQRGTQERFRKFQSVYFIRYANRYVRAQNRIFGINTLTRLNTFNTGLNFIFF